MASYAVSTQRLYWSFTKAELETKRHLDLLYLSCDEYRAIQIHIYELVKILASKLALRQQVVATAVIYLWRFYTKAALVETNIYMLIAASVYLACKIEECPLHIKTIATEIQTVWGLGKVTSETTRIAEAEFYLIEELNAHLIVLHPYRILTQFHETHPSSQKVVNEAWVIVNDSYYSDIPLIFEPDVVAWTALFLATCHCSASVSNLDPISARVPAADITRCTKAFLQLWRFRKSTRKPAPDVILREAREKFMHVKSGAFEQEVRSKKYKQKILQAMQKK